MCCILMWSFYSYFKDMVQGIVLEESLMCLSIQLSPFCFEGCSPWFLFWEGFGAFFFFLLCLFCTSIPCYVIGLQSVVTMDHPNKMQHSPWFQVFLQKGFVKVNIDGSSLGNLGTTGMGELFRDNNGFQLFGFSVSFEYSTNIMAELGAMRVGFCFAQDKGLSNIILESDFVATIELVMHDCVKSHPLYVLISNIQEFLYWMWTCRVVHTFT